MLFCLYNNKKKQLRIARSDHVSIFIDLDLKKLSQKSNKKMTHGNLTRMSCINSNLLLKITCSLILFSDVIVKKLVILSFVSGKKHYKVCFISFLQGYVLRKVKVLLSHQMCMKSHVK